MQLKEMKRALEFGLPLTALCKRVLTLRDLNINIEYFRVYSFDNKIKKMISRTINIVDFCDSSDSRFSSPNYILPIFSFDDVLYFIGYTDNGLFSSEQRFYFGSYKYSESKPYLIKQPKQLNERFMDLNLSEEDCDHLLYKKIINHEALTRYLMSNVS